MTNTKDELAELKARVAELEAKAKPPEPKPFVPDPNWENEMHQMRERRMNLASNFHPDDLRAMERACPTPMMKEIALRDSRGPTGPTGMIPSSSKHPHGGPANAPGGGTGWQAPTPLSPPPGVAQADRLMDAQDARDRAELIEREARFKAMEKLAEGNKS